jgi:hypothetical protein
MSKGSRATSGLTRIDGPRRSGARRRGFALVALSACAASMVACGNRKNVAPAAASVEPAAVAVATAPAPFGGLPVAFEQNVGQVAGEVKFLSRGASSTVFLTADETVFQFASASAAPRRPTGKKGATRTPPKAAVVAATTLRMKLKGASPEREVRGEEPLEGRANYLVGNDPSQWHKDVPRYQKVRVANAYRGVDVVYYGGQDHALEYDFVVQKGADPKQIALSFEGADKLVTGASGELEVHQGADVVVMKAPVSYQMVDGVRRSVRTAYVVDGAVATLDVGAYDRDRELVIDPLIGFSSYLGGAAVERVTCLARDASGNLYISGSTTSANFPAVGAIAGQTTLRGGRDAFVTKMNPTGTQVLYSTYLGGTGDEYMTDAFAGFETGAMRTCAVDAQSRMYVSTTTTSTDFPTTAGALDTTLGGGLDVTLSRLNPAGNALEYSTYFGGSSSEYWASIALDATGHVWMTGETASSDFPTKSPTQAVRGNLVTLDDIDTFVTRFTPDGSGTTFSTFLGGANPDYPFDIAVDGSNNAYIAGATASAGFPTTVGSLQPVYGGGNPGTLPQGDAYVTKFVLAGNGTASVGLSTFVGGSREEIGQAIALGTDGSIYLAGVTNSPNFPGQTGRPGDATNEFDGFVLKLNAAGSTRVFSKLFGQEQRDGVYDIAVNAAGNIFVAGTGTLGATTVNGCGRAGDKGILGMLKADGSGWEYLTPFGEANSQILIDASDNAYVAGWGAAGSIPVVGAVAQPTYAGGASDAYVLKLARLPNASDTGCAPCTGDVGSSGARPCTSAAPKCLASGVCAAAGGCGVDSDCGSATSGRICEANACVDGCRGTGGNGCAAGKLCSSTTSTKGTCGDPASPDASTPVADSGITPVPDAGKPVDQVLDGPGSLEGGGFSCTAGSAGAGSAGGWLVGVAVAASAMMRRRRRRF